MTPSLLVTSFLLAVSLIHRDTSFALCTTYGRPARQINAWKNSCIGSSLSPNLNTLPALHICCDRRLLPLPLANRNLHFLSSFLLLLAGDVSVNPGPAHCLRISTINARSMRDKAPALSDLIHSKSIDVLSVTETWLTTRETRGCLTDLTPAGFSFHQAPREGRSGGGVGLFVSNQFTFNPIPIPAGASFEAMCGTVSDGKVCLNILNVYRPPGACNGFFDEFQDVLCHLASLPHNMVVLGDFNLHVDSDSSQTAQFLDILSSFNLRQNVDFPTHIHGHTLDLIITSHDCHPIRVTRSDRISDHFSVIAEFDIAVPNRNDRKMIHYRNIKSINIDAFKNDILHSELLVEPCTNASDLANQYNSTLASILNRHAPLMSRRASPKPTNPWMTPEILAAKTQRRYLERVWRRNPTPLNRSRFTRQTHLCNRLMSKAKSDYYTQVVRDNSSDQRSLWRALNHVLHRSPPRSLPEFCSIGQLATRFGSFFKDKITAIRTAFPNTPMSDDTVSHDILITPSLSTFCPATEDEIRRLVMAAPNKSCNLDPIPTPLLKTCIDVLLTTITSLVNKTLAEGVFPSTFKNAHVTPLLKKASLCKEDMKNYRPVSNLSFMSKLIEKIVANRILEHMAHTKSSNPHQSAYRKLHSTETALLRIQNDILTAMDKGKVTALTLLDLSAAFDTIDHAILLNRLHKWFGISGLALDWLSSYLSDRTQQIKLDDTLSPRNHIPFGVPQGSVLGPLLFTMYTTPLSTVIHGHSISHHLYADDSQLYISFSSGDSAGQLNSLKSCLDSVLQWMLSNKLKLNPGKTEFLLIGHRQQRQKFSAQFPINLMGIDTSPSKSARNLGVVFDQNFNFRKHISQVCSSCYYHIRDLKRIRKHLTLDSAKSLAYALVSSRLDYCNSLLFGVTAGEIYRLQRIQNTLARIVTGSRPYAHAPPLLQSLHWLPIKSRIVFKIGLLTFKTLQTKQPAYLNSMLTKAIPTRTLRSNQAPLLNVPKTKTVTGSRAFSSCAPTLWNTLPLSLRSLKSVASFRKHLKTHLFRLTYPP